ncbi:MAG: hypothetical protein ACRELY_27485, partial [Polyangiaceae bacterium]
MSLRFTTRFVSFFFGASFILAACSSHNSVVAGNDGGSTAVGSEPADDDFCKAAATCSASKPVNACGTCVQAPTADLARGTGLHYFSSNDPTVDLGCLTNPPAQGTSQMVTLAGYVKLFSSGNDSQGVKVEVYQEGGNHDGALGALVGSFTTTGDDVADPPQTPLPPWSTKCPDGGCKLRTYFVANVPTETQLVIKTSDANQSGQWS